MNPNMPQDELLQRYEQAKAALPDGLPDTPSAALHERIMRAAREQANAINKIAPRADSIPATSPKSIENKVEAANDSIWNIKLVASLAVMGLSGLLWWQFEHGTPEEQEAARSAKPSPTVVAAAPAPAPAAPLATANSEPASAVAAANPTAPATGAAPTAAAIRKETQAKKSSEAKSEAAQAEPSVVALPAPAGAAAPEAPRARAQEITPPIAAAPAPAPAAAPALPQFSQTDKAIAADIPSRKAPPSIGAEPSLQRSLETAQAPNMAASPQHAAPAPASAARAAMPSPAAAPRMAAPAPVAPAASAFSRQTLLTAIEAKDAAALRQSLTQGISPNVIATDGNPALQQAVIQRWPEGVRILLAAGADRNAKNRKGQTAADVALELGYEDISRLLDATR